MRLHSNGAVWRLQTTPLRQLRVNLSPAKYDSGARQQHLARIHFRHGSDASKCPATASHYHHGTTRVDTKLLNAQLRNARGVEELQRLFYQHRERLDHIHLAALMGSLARAAGIEEPVDFGTVTHPVHGTAANAWDGGSNGQKQQRRHDTSRKPYSAAFLPHVLLDVVQQQKRMATRQCSNIMWALAKLIQGPQRSGFDGVQRAAVSCMECMLARVLQQLPAASSQDVAQVLYAVSISSHWLPSILTADSLAQILRHLHDHLPSRCNAQDMSMTIYALARLGHVPSDPHWLPHFERCSIPLLPSFTGQALANTIWALVEVRHSPTPAWSAAFITALHKRMPALLDSELAISARSVVSMRMQPNREWVVTLHWEVLARLACMNCQDLGLSMAALASLGVRPSRQLLARLSKRLVTSDPCTQLSKAIASHAAAGRIPHSRSPDHAAAHGFEEEQDCRSGFHSGRGATRMPDRSGSASTSASASSINSQATHMILRALAHMHVVPSEALISSLLTSVSPQLHSHSSPQDCMLLLHAMARLKYHPPARFMLRFMQHSRYHLHQFSPKQLAGTFYALGRLNMRPERRWMEAALSKASLLQFGPHEVANIVWALARMGYTPTVPWMHQLFARVIALLPSFSAAEMAMMLEALAKARLGPPPGWLQLIQDELSRRITSPCQAGGVFAIADSSVAASGAEAHPGYGGQGVVQHGRRSLQRKFVGFEYLASLRALSSLHANERAMELSVGALDGRVRQVGQWQGTSGAAGRVVRVRPSPSQASLLPGGSRLKATAPRMQWSGKSSAMDAMCLASLTRLWRWGRRTSSGGDLNILQKCRKRLGRASAMELETGRKGSSIGSGLRLLTSPSPRMELHVSGNSSSSSGSSSSGPFQLILKIESRT